MDYYWIIHDFKNIPSSRLLDFSVSCLGATFFSGIRTILLNFHLINFRISSFVFIKLIFSTFFWLFQFLFILSFFYFFLFFFSLIRKENVWKCYYANSNEWSWLLFLLFCSLFCFINFIDFNLTLFVQIGNC